MFRVLGCGVWGLGFREPTQSGQAILQVSGYSRDSKKIMLVMRGRMLCSRAGRNPSTVVELASHFVSLLGRCAQKLPVIRG